MKEDLIKGEYLSRLTSFLSAPDEGGLQRGYEYGRNALTESVGLLQIAETHMVALAEILSPISKECADAVTATQELLSAILAPFEMTHRGYQASISKLTELNQVLGKQSAELTVVNQELETFNSAASHELAERKKLGKQIEEASRLKSEF